MTRERDIAPVSCRQCGGAMSAVVYGPVTIDRCAHCGGLWFDGGELEAALTGGVPDLGRGASPVDTTARRASLACPRCAGARLREVQRDAVTVHACESCRGVFVSHEALGAIVSRARTRNSPWWDVQIDPAGEIAAELTAGAVKAALQFLGKVLDPL